MITHESIDLDTSDAAVVRVRYVQMDDDIDMGGELVIDRATVPYLVEQVDACANVYPYPQTSAKVGTDELRIYASGSDQMPIVNVINRRPEGGKAGGLYGLMLTVPYAQRLVGLLRALRN